MDAQQERTAEQWTQVYLGRWAKVIDAIARGVAMGLPQVEIDAECAAILAGAQDATAISERRH